MAAPNSSFSFPCPHSHFILSRNQKTGAVTENRKHHLNKHLSLPSIVLCSCLVKFSSCQICPSQYSFSLALFFFSQHTSISASYFGMPSGPDGSTTEGQHFFSVKILLLFYSPFLQFIVAQAHNKGNKIPTLPTVGSMQPLKVPPYISSFLPGFFFQSFQRNEKDFKEVAHNVTIGRLPRAQPA